MNRRESSRSRSMSRSRSRSPSSAKASRNSDRGRTSRTPERRRRSRNKYSRGRSRDRTRSPSSRRRSKYSDSRSRSRSSPDRRVDYRRKSSSRSPVSDRRRHENPPENRCLGVFGLSVLTTEQKLYHLFSKYGPLERVQLVIDAKTNRSRGFCFVYFENAEDAKVAKEQCSGLEIDGRLIRVDYSITLRPHTPTPGVYMGNRTRNHRKYDERYNRDEDYRRDRYSKYRDRSPSPHYRRERSRRYYRSHSRSRSRYRHER